MPLDIIEQSLLTVHGLVTSFPSGKGRVSAVNDINFNIRKGEVVALVGESGSGKSVTGLSIMRLIEAGGGSIDAGHILYHSDGVSFDLVSFTEEQMKTIRGRQISMIFQDPMSSLNPALTCGQQLIEMIQHHLKYDKTKAKEHAIDLLEQVEIPNPREALLKYPHQFSGGQLQRMLIAMSISCSPELVIADEPTTALDAAVRTKVLQILKKVQRKRNLSVLFVTHDLDVVKHFADKICVMYAGKIVERGTVEEIYARPKHPYTKGLLACRPPKQGRYYFLPTISDFMRISNDGKDIDPTAELDEIFRDLEISETSRNTQLRKIYQSEPILKVSSLQRNYTKKLGLFKQEFTVEAVSNVSFNLFHGETLGLVGESGCGKSTLAKAIIGLINKERGLIEIYNEKTGEYVNFEKQKNTSHEIQYIFQDPLGSLNPGMTIGDALMEPLSKNKKYNTKAEKLDRVHELLIQVGLKPYHINRYPFEFSGGQRQRIGIARALLLEPKILICDEVVSALDVSVQAQVLNLFNELKYEYGLSYIFISHDLSVVRYMCDRILVMKDGKIIEEGDADNMFLYPRKQYTKDLVRATMALAE